MTRPGSTLVPTTATLVIAAFAITARAQSPAEPPGLALRLPALRSLAIDSPADPAGFPEDVFHTTLAPLSRRPDVQPDVVPDVQPESGRGRKWSLALEAYTHTPVDIGGGVLVETPFGLRLSTGLGWVPPGYLNLMANVATSASGVDSATGTLVRNGVDGGNVWRAQLGIRPIGGLYFDAGYALVTLHGNVTATDIAPTAGLSLAGTGLENAAYALHSTIHMWTAEAGWQARIGGHVLLGLGVGMMGTISSSTRADPNFALGSTSQAQILSQSATNRIDTLVKRYGFVPTVQARLGFDLL